MSKEFPAQYEIWFADLNPSAGSEPGKIRPIVLLQSDVLNRIGHSIVIVCAISSQHKAGVSLLRLPVEPTATNGLTKTSYILCDQIRAIDTIRLKSKIGALNKGVILQLNESIRAVLTL